MTIKEIVQKIFCPKPTPIIFITPYTHKIWGNVNSRKNDFKNASKDMKYSIHNKITFFENYFEAYEYLKIIYTNQDSSKRINVDLTSITKYPLKAIIEETGYESSVASNDENFIEIGVAPDKRIKKFSKFESEWLENRKTWNPFNGLNYDEFHSKLESEIFKQAPNFLKEINFHYISEYNTSMLKFFQNHKIERIPIQQGIVAQTKHMSDLVYRLNKNYSLD